MPEVRPVSLYEVAPEAGVAIDAHVPLAEVFLSTLKPVSLLLWSTHVNPTVVPVTVAVRRSTGAGGVVIFVQ